MLALGLAAPAVFFSLLWGGGLRTLPVPNGHEVVRLEIREPASSRELHVRQADLEALRASGGLTALEGYAEGEITLRTETHGTVRIGGAALTSGALETLGIPPLVGRIPDGDDPGALLLGHRVWREVFLEDSGVVGQRAVVNGRAGRIAGVMPEGFGFPTNHEAWTVLPSGSEEPLTLFGRRGEDVSLHGLSSELTARWRQGDGIRPAQDLGGVVLVRSYTSGRGESGEAWLFGGLVVVGLALLLIATVNAANLLVVRSSDRVGSLSVQLALGAGRLQIAAQLLLEALLLAAMGGAAGLVLTRLVVDHIQATASGNFGYYWMRMAVEPPVILFVAVLVVGTALLAGLAPVRRVLGWDIQGVLKGASFGTMSAEGRWARVLTSAQLALSCSALVAAGLASQALGSAARYGEGLPADEVVMANVSLSESVFPEAEERLRIVRRLEAELPEAVGEGPVALAWGAPGFQEPYHRVEIRGVSGETAPPMTGVNAVGPGFFEIFGVASTRGASLHEAALEGGPAVAVVNEAWVQHILPGGDAVGRLLEIPTVDSTRAFTIVGVVETLPLGAGPPSADARVYLPLRQVAGGTRLVLGRKREAPETMTSGIRRALAEIHPDLALSSAMTLREGIEWITRAQGTLALLAAGGGYAGILVAAVGLYALLAFRVRQRRRELGVRLALGADGTRLGAEILVYALRQIAPAMAVGLGLAWLVAPVLGAILLGNDPRSPLTFLSVAGGFLTVGLLAALRPAILASRVEPMTVLKGD